MRTSAMRCPATSKRLASPGASSSVLHNATVSDTVSATGAHRHGAQCGFETVVHLALEQRCHRGNGSAVDDGVEEATHDQALRHLWRHAPGFDVVALVLVDRADRGGVGALHVVLENVEIGYRIRVRALVENEVVVG